jgi:hypothetical protein
MSNETNTLEEEAPITKESPYTEAEMKQMRAEMSKFYSEEIKFLKKQEEYERLLADIEEHKTRKFTMMQRAAQMFAAAEAAQTEYEEQEKQSESEAPTKERKLKTT